MRIRRKTNILILMVAGILMLVSFTLACGTVDSIQDVVEEPGAIQTTTSSITKTFSGDAGQQIETLAVPDGAKVVDLRIKSDLRSGTMSWKVVDPTGNIRWEESITGATIFFESRRFDAVTGEWRLQINLAGATGSYDISWETN